VVRGALEVSGSTFADVRAGPPWGPDTRASANSGGAIRAYHSEVSVTASSFNNSRASGGRGGAISTEGGALAVADSAFDACFAYAEGGAVAAGESDRVGGDESLELTVSGCTFVDCFSQLDGGAVNSFSHTTTVRGSHFENCISKRRHGSAMLIERENGRADVLSSTFLRNGDGDGDSVLRFGKLRTATIRGSTFDSNRERKSVVILMQLDDVDITGSRFLRNAGQALRAFQLFEGTFTIDDCVFADNVANAPKRVFGGAMLLKESPQQRLRITRTQFLRNKLVGGSKKEKTFGGALNLKAKAVIDSCHFEGNEAYEGGAIAVDANGDLTVTNTSFVENTAEIGGAVSACASSSDFTCGGEVRLSDVRGVGNVALLADASKKGGGFAHINGAMTTMRNVVLRDNTAAGVGSAVGFRYAEAELFSVEAGPDQIFFATYNARLDVFCNPITIVSNQEGRNVIEGNFTAGECSGCPPGYDYDASAYECLPCPRGSYKAEGMETCEKCPKRFYQPDNGRDSCVQCPNGHKVTGESTACFRRKKSKTELPTWVAPVGYALLALVTLIGIACFVVRARRFVRAKRKLEIERAVTVQQQVVEATERVADFQAHFYAVPGDVFVGLGALRSHEALLGELAVYPVQADVRKAAVDEKLVFMFLSHQWLGFDHPDPERLHYKAMRQAVDHVAKHAQSDLSCVRVWVDYASIPQKNRAEQRLAIASLPTFASCCDYFVVVAPDAVHQQTNSVCDSRSYRKRAWCRAEIMSCWARNGTTDMYFSTNSGLRPLAFNDADLVEALDVFGGELTCCRLGHPDGQPCDREALMLPMLGLFADIYRDRRGGAREAYEVVEPILDKVYPRTFEWVYSPPGAVTAATEVQTLFGDLVDACKYSIDLSEAAEGDAIFRQKVPDFQPGTNARRRTHHVTHGRHSDSFSKHGLITGFIQPQPSRTHSRRRSGSTESSQDLAPLTSDDHALVHGSSHGSRHAPPPPRPGMGHRQMTWRASPPRASLTRKFPNTPSPQASLPSGDGMDSTGASRTFMGDKKSLTVSFSS